MSTSWICFELSQGGPARRNDPAKGGRTQAGISEAVSRTVRDREALGSNPRSPTMNYEKWKEIKGQTKERFSILEEGEENLDPGMMEFLVFESPLGKMKLEFYKKPRVIDRRMNVSKRIGAQGREELIYGDEEVCFLKAFKEVGGEWEEVDYKN